MFNPHIHQQQQQQQQQQFHQHLRQLQQLFQQQQPPPPPPPQPPPGHHVPHHHHQTPRPIPGPPQTAPPPRMVNLCQATQTTILAPNPMLQGALLMQQMQGNMRGFGMGGQQFRQFFAASNRSSLLGPVPMGMAIKSPIMGFPAARPFHPHARFFNNNIPAAATTASSSSSISTTEAAAAHEMDRKRDSEQMATESSDDHQAGTDTTLQSETEGSVRGVEGQTQPPEDQAEEPVLKKQRTDGPEEQCAAEAVAALADEEVLSSDSCGNTEDIQPEDDLLLEDEGSGEMNVEMLEESRASEVHTFPSGPSPSGRLVEYDQPDHLPLEEISHVKDAPLASPSNQEEGEEGVADGANKFYCYLCSITCHNQQNFRSHMNSVSHQQRMMEIQHMSNACLVTLLPRVQESLQGTSKEGEKRDEQKQWCPTCHTHFTSSVGEHRRTEEHKLASRAIISSCTICKKHFRSSQEFVEHLQSLEHRQKVEKENEGCEASSKLPAMEADGLSLEEGEEGEESLGEGEQDSSVKQDGWSPIKEVTLRDLTSDDQYDPDTVYGSSFLVPVAGFICRLCNKFFHFESSALHTHCKSVTHFEKLKKYKETLSPTEGENASPREPLSPGPPAESPSSSSREKPSSDDTGAATNVNSEQSTAAVCGLIEAQRPEDHAEPDAAAQDLCSSAEEELLSMEEETVSLPSGVQETPAEDPAGSTEEPQPGAAAEDDDEEEGKEVPAVPGKNKNGGRAKAARKRRSGRVTNRR
ncbi:cdkn1a interacting zinc finger protein 1a [Takifugu rubripes]|uniref:Cdkn1a interacting zinc finger protein 1a n=1 Tax=Takifugu rubripes TaxID=31033 RepID=H2VEZ2_TAKRU|nr:cip1-interacting zinc finger protein [Takifugu rubripes]